MNDLLTDSFVGDSRGQHPIDNDIEMGMRVPRSNSDMGMEAFNKQIQDVEKQVDKQLVFDPKTMQFKDFLALKYAKLDYAGLAFDPLRESMVAPEEKITAKRTDSGILFII